MKATIYSNRREAIKIKLFIILFLLAFFTIAQVTRGQNREQQSSSAIQQNSQDNWSIQMNHAAGLLNLYAGELSDRAAKLYMEALNRPDACTLALICAKADCLGALSAEKRSEHAKILLAIGKEQSSINIAMSDK